MVAVHVPFLLSPEANVHGPDAGMLSAVKSDGKNLGVSVFIAPLSVSTPDSSTTFKVTVTSTELEETSAEDVLKVRSDRTGAFVSSVTLVTVTSMSIEADAEPVLAVKVTL